MTRSCLACLSPLLLIGLCATAPEPAGAQERSSKTITNSIGMELALIPPGKFLMGSPESEIEREADEQQHEVVITKPFHMGVHEVTQGQYQKVIGKNPAFFNPGGGGSPDHPVEQVLWRDAVEFCSRLSGLEEEKKAGRTYRLPTEAEWEYACRAGGSTVFHFGAALSSKQANFNGAFPYGAAANGPYLAKTAKAGSYPANAFGLHDMHGNVWEWCSDWYDENYYKNSPREDPQGPPAGVLPTGFKDFYRVARGGCWLDEARGCRAAYRFRFMPSDPYRLVGFRVVCVVDAKAP